MLAGCGNKSRTIPPKGNIFKIDLDKSHPELLIRYYFGSYVSVDGADPIKSGLIEHQDNSYYLHLDSLRISGAKVKKPSLDSDDNGVIDWDELKLFVQKTYYSARKIPTTIDEFRKAVDYSSSKTGWEVVVVDGVMTEAQRHIYVSITALTYALSHYKQNANRLIYPVGTIFVGEHRVNRQLAETTVMRKRGDGFWDFFVYDKDGRLSHETSTPPKALKAPIQCLGCHTGSKLFNPEKSYPADSPPGPHGPRGIYGVPDPVDTHWVQMFKEHSKRSDTILGIYNTLYMERLCYNKSSDMSSEMDLSLIKSLGGCEATSIHPIP